jgi:glycosyltransferase involved in cell wall biosynthesis
MRVLHVIPSLSPMRGGTTTSVLEIIAGLKLQGVDCEVAVSDDDGPGRRIADGAAERVLPGRYYFVKRRDLYVYTPDMGPWLDTHVRDYDLVHIHGLFSHANGLAGRICRRRRVPYIVTPHGMANRYGMRQKRVRKALSLALVERRLLDSAAAVHMTSRGEERDFADLGIKAPVVRIPLPVAAVPLGNPAAFLTRYPETAHRRLAVFIGRLNPIKNLEVVIDALALVGGAEVHLVVGGDGPVKYVQSLKARAAARGVADRITWLGFVLGKDKVDLLAAGDIYVQPSLSESFGMAAVEAVSAGLPCVLGESVSIAEDLVPVGFAVSVPPTAEAVANAINSVGRLRDGKPDYAVIARDFVTSTFGWNTIGPDILQMYAQASRGGAEERS